MVVEDDEAHRVALERHLTRSGYEVLACDSAEQALARFSTFNPVLVLSDIRMGAMSGLDLLRTLVERAPTTRVLLTTAYDDMQMAVDAMKQGAFDFLCRVDRVVEVFEEQRQTETQTDRQEKGGDDCA